jgi:hypothetical protein
MSLYQDLISNAFKLPIINDKYLNTVLLRKIEAFAANEEALLTNSEGREIIKDIKNLNKYCFVKPLSSEEYDNMKSMLESFMDPQIEIFTLDNINIIENFKNGIITAKKIMVGEILKKCKEQNEARATINTVMDKLIDNNKIALSEQEETYCNDIQLKCNNIKDNISLIFESPDYVKSLEDDISTSLQMSQDFDSDMLILSINKLDDNSRKLSLLCNDIKAICSDMKTICENKTATINIKETASQKFAKTLSVSAAKALTLCNTLKSEVRLDDILEINDPPADMWSFRIKYKHSKMDGINGLSISKVNPNIIEVALLNCDTDELIYNSAYGYGDVKYFTNYEALVKEIISLHNILRRDKQLIIWNSLTANPNL